VHACLDYIAITLRMFVKKIITYLHDSHFKSHVEFNQITITLCESKVSRKMVKMFPRRRTTEEHFFLVILRI